LISLEQFLVFFFTALIPSVMGAISGIGGGIIIKPILDTFFSLKAEEINFLAGATVLTMSFVTMLQNRIKNNRLTDRRGIVLALGGVLGGVTGKFAFNAAISMAARNLVGIIQSGILILLCAAAFFYMLNKNKITPLTVRNIIVCFLLGLFMGMVSAFLGIGGGPINIMIISYFLGMESKTTSLYSIYVICLSQLASLLISIVTKSVPQVPIAILITMASGGVIGGLMGSAVYQDMNNSQVDKLFRVILISVMLLSLFHLVKSSILIPA